MSDLKISITIKTSEKFGKDYCDYECEHIETYTKFPPVAICKITNAQIQADKDNLIERPASCKYMCGEEVEDHFWSPLKGYR